MPEVAEAPVETVVAPAAPVAEPTLGDVWRANMAKAEKGNQAEVPDKPVAERPAAKAEVKPAEKPAAKTDSKADPLDKLIGEKPVAAKPDAAAEEVPADAPAKQLRSAYERAKADAQHWKAEAEKAAAPKPEITGKIESLEKERAEWQAERAKLKDAITALNVEYDPEYQAKFVEGRKAGVQKAADKLTAFGGDGAALADALSMPEGKARNAAIKDAVVDLDDIDRAKVLREIERVEALDEESAALRKDPQQTWEKMTRTQQEAAQKQAEEAEHRKDIEFERVTKALPESFILARTMPEDSEGAAEWNGAHQAALENARRLLGSETTYQEVAQAAIKASFADKLQEMWIAERTSRAALEKELASFRQSEPGFRGTGAAPAAGNLDKTPGQIWREGMARASGKNV